MTRPDCQEHAQRPRRTCSNPSHFRQAKDSRHSLKRTVLGQARNDKSTSLSLRLMANLNRIAARAGSRGSALRRMLRVDHAKAVGQEIRQRNVFLPDEAARG